MRSVLALACASSLVGCLTFGPGGSSNPEDDDGESSPSTFDVAATQRESSCGTGQLQLDASWSFEADLVAQPSEGIVSWDIGEGSSDGELDTEERTFTVSSSHVVNMRTSQDPAGLPPCSIRRVDELEAKLDDAAEPTSFEGTLTYRYEPTDGSDCSDLLVGDARIVAALPCVVVYEIEGEARAAEEAD